MKKIALIVPGLVIALPLLVSAQNQFVNLEGLIKRFGDLVAMLIPIMFGLALLFFLWGLVKFIFAAGDEAAKDTGKRIMIWGIIALAVMASVWGLVNFLTTAFGINQGQIIIPPAVPVPAAGARP